MSSGVGIMAIMRQFVRVVVTSVVIGGGIAGCGSAPVAKDTSGNPMVASAKEAEAALGQKVRVIGEAVNAKLSAAVEGEDDWIVYVVDMRRWPDAVEGTRVEVTGILGKREDQVAAPGSDPVTTTDKAVHVLRESSYLVMDD